MEIEDRCKFDREVVWFEREPDKEGKPIKYTGRTFAVIWKGTNRFIGISNLSRKDQFSRKIGRLIATGRAKWLLKLSVIDEFSFVNFIANGGCMKKNMFYTTLQDKKFPKDIPSWMWEEKDR